MAYTTIAKPNTYFNTLLYSGDGSSPRNLTGVGFQPDFTWIKQRSSTNTHVLWDAVRGAGADKEICTASSGAEGGQQSSLYGYLSSFDSDGFTATTGSTNIGWVNNSGQTYASWNWLANGAGVSNTDGSITSTVSASTTSGFSIVQWTGTGSNATVGHGLGVEPKCFIMKKTSNTSAWSIYHKDVGNTKFLTFSTDVPTLSSTVYNNTSPTSSVFSIGTADNGNASGQTYIGYFFADKKGFSKFGSYVANANTDGTFVYTGFKPAFIIVKNTTSSGNWFMLDNKRNTYNVVNSRLTAENTYAEDTASSYDIDFLSNGFKLRTNSNPNDGAGNTYIYMAFAENPIVTTDGLPATAR